MVVERPGPAQQPGLEEISVRHEKLLTELREDVEHEYNRRHDLLNRATSPYRPGKRPIGIRVRLA